MSDNRPQTVVRQNNVPGFQDLRAARLCDITEPMMARVELAAEFPNAGVEPTGIDELDNVVRFQAGRMAVLGGREGAGKSALALQIARWWSGRGATLYVLTEMSIEEVVERIVAATAHIPVWQIQKSPSPDQRAKVRGALEWLAKNSNLTIVEAQGIPMDELTLRIRDWAKSQRNGARGVIIDNLWGLAGASGVRGQASEVSIAIGNIARQVANLSLPIASGGIDCPVVLLHHLNRGATGGNSPTTATLGGSDQIGYWASQVILVAEEKVVGAGDGAFGSSGATHALHITKNRGGRAGVSIPLSFLGEQMRFVGAGTPAPFAKPEAADIVAEKTYRQKLAELPSI